MSGASGRPTISLLLLCWNHAKFLATCIESVAKQQPGAEIVFLDNASTDGSFELAQSLFDRFGLTAKMIRNEQPQSIPANCNRLLAASNGAIVAPLSTDDWFEATYVESVMQAAVDAPEAGWFSCSGWLYYDAEQKDVPVDDSQFVTDRSTFEMILDGDLPHFVVGCAYRRSALEAVGGWDEGQMIEDRDLFLRLSQSFTHHRTTQRLVHYRRNSMSASADGVFMLNGWDLFFAKHAKLFGQRLSTRRAETYRAYAAMLIDQGRFGAALSALGRSLRLRPVSPLNWRTLAYLGRTWVKER